MSEEEPKTKLTVVPFTKKQTKAELQEFPPDEILRISKGMYKCAIIMGWDKDDELNYILSDGVTSGEALLLMEVVKADIVGNMFDQD